MIHIVCNSCGAGQSIDGELKLPEGWTAYQGTWAEFPDRPFTIHACPGRRCVEYAKRETAASVPTPF